MGVAEKGTGIQNGPETYQQEFVGIMGHNTKPLNPMTIVGNFNLALPEEQSSIWARIWVLPHMALTPKVELHNEASQMGCEHSISVN